MAHTKQEFVVEYLLRVRPPVGRTFDLAIKYAEELYEEVVKTYPELGLSWDGRPVPTPEPPKETPKETKMAPVATGVTEVGKKKKSKK